MPPRRPASAVFFIRVAGHTMAASKILIVEDEAPIREMIAFHLSRAGYETIEAADCRSARALLADERPDLALIDWMLPDMSGLELMRALKREQGNEDLGIIMLTARAAETRQGFWSRRWRRRLRHEAIRAARVGCTHSGRAPQGHDQ